MALAFGFVSLLVFLPSYFIGALGYSIQRSGLVMLMLTIPVLALPTLAGAASRRIPVRTLLGVSLLLVGSGAAWLTVIGTGTSVLTLAPPLVVIGIGVGISFGLLDGAAISSVPPERAGMAAGMFNTSRLTSEAVVIAGMGSILVTLTQQKVSSGLAGLGSSLTAPVLANKAVQGTSVSTLAQSGGGRVGAVQQLITSSYTSALHTVLWILTAGCVIGAPAIVALLKERVSPAVADAAMTDADLSESAQIA